MAPIPFDPPLRRGKVSLMKRPIEVWFSALLIILVPGAWIGSGIGATAARYWYGQHPLEEGHLSQAERARMQTLFSALQAAEFLRLYANVSFDDKKLEAKYLSEIANLERLNRRSNIEEVRPILAFDLGLAHIDAAMVEEQNDETHLAKQHMEAAKSLFESLGWQDCSDETLRAVAKRDQHKWNPGLPKKAGQ
jgi:hypothetical protein